MSTAPISGPLGDAEKETTGAALQSVLGDLIDLSLIAKQAHWNVVGKQFRNVHLHLDELTSTARNYVDQLAERANAIGVSPNGTAKTVSETSGLPEYPNGWQSDADTVANIVDILGTLIRRVREQIEKTDKTDLVTQDLLIALAAQLEKDHWMWQAQQA